MEAQVDWINLMSYDLHGVWDSSNPIGNQVLSHTNLTEIDHALDLVRSHCHGDLCFRLLTRLFFV